MYQPGDILDDRYEIQGTLGHGGMAHVFRARDRHLDRDVALKVLRPHLTETDSERFRREIRTLARLSHPGIVNIFDLGSGNNVYFVMELITGGPITELGPFEGDTESMTGLLDALIMVADALAYVHRLGIVHRDLTPRNILMTGNRLPKVMDFGLVQLTETSQQLTRTGFTLGTPQYMAPEQARGDLTGHATDLYAFGAVMYHILTGVAPFEAENDQAVLYQHVYDEPRNVLELNPLVPDELAALVNALLSKDPASRPASGELVSDSLASIRSSSLARSVNLALGGPARRGVYPTGPTLADAPRLIWRQQLSGGPQWPAGIGAAEGVLLLGLRDDRTAVLRPSDGQEIMSIPADDEVITPPVYSAGRLNIVSRDGSLRVAEWPSGKQLVSSHDSSTVGVLPYGRNLLATSARGTLELLDLKLQPVWAYQASAPATTPPALHAGHVVFQTEDGWLHAVDAASGEGRFKIEIGSMAAAPAGQEGVIILTVRSGELHAFDSKAREVRWSYDLDGEVYGSPAIWQNRLYVAGWDRKLSCLSFSSGEDLWSAPLSGAVTASPVVAGGHVYVVTETGDLLAFDARTGHSAWSERVSHGPVQASPLPIGSRLVVAALDGTVSCYSG